MLGQVYTRRSFLAGAARSSAGVISGTLLGFSLAASWEKKSEAEEDTLARGRRQGYLNIGFNNNKPLSYIDPTTGHLTGSSPAVLTPALRNLGIPQVHYTVVDFAGIIPGLLDKRWDISGIAFFITPERCAKAAFTNPINKYTEGALVRKGNPYNVHSYVDMAKNPKMMVAIQEGDAEVVWAKQSGIKDIVLFPQEPLAVQALKEGRVDAYLNSTFALTQDMKNYGGEGIALAVPFTGPIVNGKEVIAYAGFALRHEDVSLLNALDEQIAKMNTSGQLLKLQQAFEFTADTIPPVTLTAKDLCPDAPWDAGYKEIRK